MNNKACILYFALFITTHGLFSANLLTVCNKKGDLPSLYTDINNQDQNDIMGKISKYEISKQTELYEQWSNYTLYINLNTDNSELAEWFATFFIPHIKKNNTHLANYYQKILPSAFLLRSLLPEISAQKDLHKELTDIVRIGNNYERFYMDFGTKSDLHSSSEKTRQDVSQKIYTAFAEEISPLQKDVYFTVAFNHWVIILIKKIKNELLLLQQN